MDILIDTSQGGCEHGMRPKKQRTEQEHESRTTGRRERESMSLASLGFWPAALHRCILEHGDVQTPFWTGLL